MSTNVSSKSGRSALLDTRRLATAAVSAAAGFGALAATAPDAWAGARTVCTDVTKTFPANCASGMNHKLSNASAETQPYGSEPCIHYHASNGGNYYSCADTYVSFPIAPYRKKSMQCYPHSGTVYFYFCETLWPS